MDTTELAPSIERLTVEVKFYLGQTAQNIIEVGKRLIQAKELLPHGEWGNWLADNFNLSQMTANNFMRVAERFGKFKIDFKFQPTQMIAMLSLPEADTESFIDTKAAEGKPVEDMTVKQLREEVQQWKDKAEKASADNEQGKAYNVSLRKDRDRFEAALRDAERKLQNQPQVITKAPDDYEQIKRDLAKLRNEKSALQKKLDATSRNVDFPADYHSNKNRLAELDAKIAAMQKVIDAHVSAEDYAIVAQKLDSIFALITDVSNSPNAGKVIDDYERNNPDRYHLLCAKFNDFIRIMEMR